MTAGLSTVAVINYDKVDRYSLQLLESFRQEIEDSKFVVGLRKLGK